MQDLRRINAVTGAISFLVLPVAAFHLTVVAGRIGTDMLVPDTSTSIPLDRLFEEIGRGIGGSFRIGS